MKLIDLIQYLRQPMLRLRTGLWLVPGELLGKEPDYILSLPVGCDVMDLRQAVINFRPTYHLPMQLPRSIFISGLIIFW